VRNASNVDAGILASRFGNNAEDRQQISSRYRTTLQGNTAGRQSTIERPAH
jgi:hypothetical protein